MGRWRGAPEPSHPAMSQIRVRCEQCGEITLNPADITIRICVETKQAEYRFRCPDCQMIEVRTVAPRVLDLMGKYGIETEWFFLPHELYEPKNHPPITDDDLIDAHFECEAL